MIDVTPLPHLNALLNGTATALLLLGFVFIRQGRKQAHRRMMLAAAAVSAVFLVSYLTYHANAPIFKFNGEGAARLFYYAVLISHVILAAAIVPLVLLTLWRGLKGAFARHRPVARWTLPLWLYVSVTGVVIYLMLYHFNPVVPA